MSRVVGGAKTASVGLGKDFDDRRPTIGCVVLDCSERPCPAFRRINPPAETPIASVSVTHPKILIPEAVIVKNTNL